jgi:uncharacterized membrane protein YhaH (DUF805 family)
MDQVSFHISFGARVVLYCTALALLISFPKMRGKAWLISYLGLDFMLSVSWYVLYLLFRSQSFSDVTFTSWDSVIQVIGFVAFAILVGFVFAQKPVAGSYIPLGKILFSFKGRITRLAYWIPCVTLSAVNFAIWFIVAGVIKEHHETTLPLLVVLLLWVIIDCWVGLAVQVKRWHDRDKSGWMVLINLIPVVGWIWSLVELGFLKGTSGPNQYGDDPLRPTVPVGENA